MSAEACVLYEAPALRQVAGETLRPGGAELTRRALELAALPPGARVLDLGCGCGATAEACRAEWGFRAVGLDLSARMLAEARAAHSALPLLRATGMRLPFAAGALDGVLAEAVLALLPDPGAALGELARVLRPGGLLLLSDLYVREPEGVAELRGLPLVSCLRGALPRAELELRLAAQGFALRVWEEHTEALKRFSARLIFEHGSLASFWGCAAGDPATVAAIQRATTRARPGYFLAVAQKR